MQYRGSPRLKPRRADSHLPEPGTARPRLRHVHRTRVNTQGARTPAPLAGNGLPGVLARYVGIVLGDRLARRSGRSPFFTADGQPVVPPRVLSADERAALYAAPRATAG
ncbi:MAG: hypothetical protein IPN40_10935 [Uliginosibacterium sp.]|nr:hypothetical protein [Uliginosibacterium sp.]